MFQGQALREPRRKKSTGSEELENVGVKRNEKRDVGWEMAVFGGG